jgi:hypothetical protein
MRSTGIPRSKGLLGIRRIIGSRTRSVTVKRPSTSTGSLGETNTDSTNDHTEYIWLFEPNESISSELTGERLDGSLGGLVVADGSVDIEHNDRVVHGGVEYEVDTIVGHPNDDEPDGTDSPNTDFWMITFNRRQ